MPLEQRIEELLGEISEASKNVTDILREEDAALHPPEPTAEPAPSAADTITPTIDPPATPDVDETPTPEDVALEPPAAPVDAPIPELEASIDRVVEEAQRTLAETTEPAAGTTDTVAQVDDALAQNADAMMASAEVAAVDAPPEPATATAREPASDEADHTPVEAVANAVVPVVVSAPPEPLAAPGEKAGNFTAGSDDPSHHSKASRKVLRLVEVASWPISCLPVVVRDLVGWFALVTIFNAVCIWAYLII